MHTVLRATTDTLVSYLEAALNEDPDLGPLFTAGGGTMVVTANNPEEMVTNGAQGVSVWLYRFMRDEQRLNAPPERIAPHVVRRRPLPVRLYYLVTPIVAVNALDLDASPQREQEILGLVLQAMHDRPALRGADLRYTLAGSEAEVHARLEPLSLEELTRVWQALNRPYQLSASYEVSVLHIASRRPPERAVPVDVAAPEYGVIVGAGT